MIFIYYVLSFNATITHKLAKGDAQVLRGRRA